MKKSAFNQWLTGPRDEKPLSFSKLPHSCVSTATRALTTRTCPFEPNVEADWSHAMGLVREPRDTHKTEEQASVRSNAQPIGRSGKTLWS